MKDYFYFNRTSSIVFLSSGGKCFKTMNDGVDWGQLFTDEGVEIRFDYKEFTTGIFLKIRIAGLGPSLSRLRVLSCLSALTGEKTIQ